MSTTTTSATGPAAPGRPDMTTQHAAVLARCGSTVGHTYLAALGHAEEILRSVLDNGDLVTIVFEKRYGKGSHGVRTVVLRDNGASLDLICDQFTPAPSPVERSLVSTPPVTRKRASDTPPPVAMTAKDPDALERYHRRTVWEIIDRLSGDKVTTCDNEAWALRIGDQLGLTVFRRSDAERVEILSQVNVPTS